MDELVNALAGTFHVSPHPNNPNAPHPRFVNYKQRPAGMSNQDVRRERTLARQKEKRLDYMNIARRLTDGDWRGSENEEDEEAESMEVEVLIRKPGRHYKNQLMLSEWMVDRPADLEENWLMVPCPVGKRSLLVAAHGQTSVYTKSGYRLLQFSSYLPGGNRMVSASHTILDGIFVEADATFYILDLMSWGNHPVYDSETEFRFFWMTCKFAEIPELCQIGPQNKYRIVQLPHCTCTRDNISHIMTAPMNTELDGLLFYHKVAHYLFGPTPLVLWLKPYMLPEILSVPVPLSFIESTPCDYVSFAHHAERVVQSGELSKPTDKRRKSGTGRRCLGRGQRGGHDTLETAPPPAVPDNYHTSPAADCTTSPMALPNPVVSRGGSSAKGRGRGRGRSRGQGRGEGLCVFQGQHDGYVVDDAPAVDDVMEVTSQRGGRGRRGRQKRHKAQSEGMDTSNCQNGFG